MSDESVGVNGKNLSEKTQYLSEGFYKYCYIQKVLV